MTTFTIYRARNKISGKSYIGKTGSGMKARIKGHKDTLLDLANYCILMAGYLKGKRDA